MAFLPLAFPPGGQAVVDADEARGKDRKERLSGSSFSLHSPEILSPQQRYGFVSDRSIGMHLTQVNGPFELIGRPARVISPLALTQHVSSVLRKKRLSFLFRPFLAISPFALHNVLKLFCETA